MCPPCSSRKSLRPWRTERRPASSVSTSASSKVAAGQPGDRFLPTRLPFTISTQRAKSSPGVYPKAKVCPSLAIVRCASATAASSPSSAALKVSSRMSLNARLHLLVPSGPARQGGACRTLADRPSLNEYENGEDTGTRRPARPGRGAEARDVHLDRGRRHVARTGAVGNGGTRALRQSPGSERVGTGALAAGQPHR